MTQSSFFIQVTQVANLRYPMKRYYDNFLNESIRSLMKFHKNRKIV
jgi:hypothetical protein